MGNNHRAYQGNNYKGFISQDYVVPSTVPNKNPAQKEPLKCWECGEKHYFKDCPKRKQRSNVHSIEEAIIVGDMARSMPKICVHWKISKQITRLTWSKLKV